jgi:hypothetical protein
MIEFIIPDEVDEIDYIDEDIVAITTNNGYEPDSKSGHTPLPLIIIAGAGCLGFLFLLRRKENR